MYNFGSLIILKFQSLSFNKSGNSKVDGFCMDPEDTRAVAGAQPAAFLNEALLGEGLVRC